MKNNGKNRFFVFLGVLSLVAVTLGLGLSLLTSPEPVIVAPAADYYHHGVQHTGETIY